MTEQTVEPVHVSDEQFSALFQVDTEGLLFVSPVIVDWQPLAERKIRLVIDLEGQVDCGIPTIPNNLIYVYFPFDDSGLPDLVKLHALGQLAADMIRNQRAVLIHCAMGLNRSPLMAGIAMTHLGRSGSEALSLLQSQRVGVLFNKAYADYLASLPAVKP
jgi:protein-tyrosine phosphatase